MRRIDLTDGFDVHDYRSQFKLLTDSGDLRVLANREGVACPACGDAFERLVVSDSQTASFDAPPDGPFCLARAEEKVLLLTH